MKKSGIKIKNKNMQKTKIRVRVIKKVNRRKLVIIFLAAIVLLTSILAVGLYSANKFFESKQFVFKNPVVVSLFAPISIEKRVKDITVQIVELDELPLTENERYLCKKFGDQCKTALEIQRRENPKGNCEAFYVNNNGTIDFGYMQVNSVHLSQDVTIAQLVDCKSNIDIAYDIYKRDGFGAWVAYKKVIK